MLQQALQSDDTEQLVWIMEKTEQPLLTHTVRALKPQYVGKLFQQILFAFQSERSDLQENALVWLRSLLEEHWPSVVQSSPADISKLFQVQAFIKKKTHNINRFLHLKG